MLDVSGDPEEGDDGFFRIFLLEEVVEACECLDEDVNAFVFVFVSADDEHGECLFGVKVIVGKEIVGDEFADDFSIDLVFVGCFFE